jgi:hypothetical protein
MRLIIQTTVIVGLAASVGVCAMLTSPDRPPGKPVPATVAESIRAGGEACAGYNNGTCTTTPDCPDGGEMSYFPQDNAPTSKITGTRNCNINGGCGPWGARRLTCVEDGR